MARRAVPHPARVRGDARRPRRPRAQRPRAAASRCSTRQRRSTSARSGRREAGSFARDYLKGRGLGEEICREFRLGLALGGDSLARKALAKGFTRDELRAAGLTRQRGDDYFQRRLLFPLTDARGRVLGFQARQLHDDDPLHGEVREHARVGALPQGRRSSTGSTRRARRSPREDRACVVEGNTDVIALRQAGFEPVVACMGTALTEQQLQRARPADEAAVARVRRRRRRRVGDAARDGARGRSRGSTSRSSPLPPGVDPADDPTGFDAQLARRRAVRRLPHDGRDRARRRSRGRRSARSRRCSTRRPTRPSGRTRGGTRTTGSA